VPALDQATVDHLLTTTRAVRKRLDLERPVPPEVIEECLDLALQAPTGSNSQGWRWIVVTDAEKRAELADIYRKGFYPYIEMQAAAMSEPDAQMLRVADSAIYLAEHMHEVPVHVVPCIEGRELADGGNAVASGLYGSIFPAVWSFQLALRSRGLASSLTTLHLLHEDEAAELLGVPRDYVQVALLPIAYFTGDDFKPASRRPAAEVTSWEAWGETRR
jgi:nitroreductase